MANPPPPYADITGISRTVMKDNAQETLANYNGNARPGEIVADLTTDPPALYIGNNLGQLTALAGGGGGYGNTQVAQYLAAGLVGNIIPAGNNINSLGNATNQWNGLYISNTTIYMNNVPISLGPGNVLTVDGNAILSNGSNATVSTTGNVTANFFFGDGSQLTGISAFGNFISNGDSNVTIDTPNGNIAIYANTTPWSFETDGTLRLPIGEITYGFGPGPTLLSNVDANAAFSVLCTSSTANGPLAVIGTVSFDGNTGVGLIQVQDELGNVDAWLFNPGGNLVIPGNIIANSNQAFWAYSDTGLTITANVQSDINGVSMEDGADTYVYANANVVIQTNVSGAGNISTWTFSNDGNLRLAGASAASYINSVANSSGDGLGYTTLQLIPDETLTGGDQYIILDPTAPGHIHIRAGGTQDNSGADLFLGGEYSYFKVGNGPNSEVYVSSNSREWMFGADGNLNLAQDGNLVGRTGFNNGRQEWLGNSAGDGSGATTLRLIPDVTLEANEQYIIIDPTGGGDIHIRPGGNIDNSNGRLILGGENSAFVVESGPNPPVKIFSDENEWAFYSNAELQAPGAITTSGNVSGNVGLFNDVNVNNAGANKLLYTDDNRNIYDTSFGYDAANSAISGSGNITAGYFSGDGSLLTSVNAVTVDITDTNGLTTIYYPTFVENRTTAQIARADVNFTYRTDTNTLTVGDIVTPPVPLANLTPVAGARAFVSDANLVAAGNFGANISGGASNTVPVWSDGTNWYIG